MRRYRVLSGIIGLITIFLLVPDLSAVTEETGTAVTNRQVRGNAYIVVDKPAMTLYVVADCDTLFSSSICAGTNYGNKQCRGDRRTPEGTFSISRIQNSTRWSHDFHDGNGKIPHAYGPWFFRLKCHPWHAIGIHGTCFPESIGKRESEGCIRLNNDDLIRLREFVYIGMKVIILPDTAFVRHSYIN